tara:strand:+ start:61 stop:1251 length:1191 start_codon:yes stop_codon:yes gene_type:complete
MNSLPANSPRWFTKKILEKGGILSFYDYMNIALNDPINGYYGSGKAKIGKNGDFVTSPSLSDDFALLLANQLEEWILQVKSNLNSEEKISILEFGSGNGCLLAGIINYFLDKNSQIINDISFKIIELNIGMFEIQKINLKKFLELGIDIRWVALNDLKDNNLNGIVIAHEVLDAFCVERIQYKKGVIYQQGVQLNKENQTLKFVNLPITKKIKKFIKEIKNELEVNIPPLGAAEEWTTELNIDNLSWLENLSKKLNNGILLIIDYAIDSKKYYSPQKNDGTILAYKNQRAFTAILNSPGEYDLTTHICSDLLIYQAKSAGFESLGLVKQGEALLLLGLAQKMFEIQNNIQNDLSQALLRREALLRLVDPICLGDIKWFVFKKSGNKDFFIKSKCIK